MHALMRFLSWRVVVALFVALPLALLCREVVGWWRPEGVELLGSDGLRTLRRLVSCSYSFAFGVWAWWLVGSVAGAFPRLAVPWIKRAARAWCWVAVLVAVPVSVPLLVSLVSLSAAEIATVLGAAHYIVTLPIAIGCVPLALVFATEYVKASPRLYFWFYAGRGEFGGFASSYTVWQNSEPMLKELK